MKVSVIIPTKNPGVLFRKVLSAVLEQKIDYPFEVLVIDSGSTDGTLDFIESVGDLRVRCHSIEPASFGHGRTRNLGISMISGEYIALLTHDALPVNEHWLSELVRVADSDEMIAGVFGRHLAYEEADPFTKQELILHFSGFSASPVVSLDDSERYRNDAGYRQYLHFFSDNNALVRRSAWEKHPYPDVDFAEDQIWAQKIIEAGYKKAYAENAVVYHSHDYTLIERFRRSFDESYAFRRLFGYILCPSIKGLFRSWVALSNRDINYARQTGLWRRAPLAVLKAPSDNLMRVLGHYFGARGDRLPKRLKVAFSHDKRLMLGLRAAKGEVEG